MRHPATHQRPQTHTGFPDGKQPQRHLFRIQYYHLRHCAAGVQRHDIPYFHGRKHPVRHIRLALHEEARRTGPQAFRPAKCQPKYGSATGERHAGDKAQCLRATETLGMGADTS